MARVAPILLGLTLLLVASGLAAAQSPPDVPPEVPPDPPVEPPANPPQVPPESPPMQPPQGPPVDPGPASAGTSDSHEEDCASTDNGSTCYWRHRESAHAGVDGVARVTVSRTDHHVEGSHDGSGGSAPNDFESNERTRTVRLDVEAGPAPATASVSVANSTRYHRQTDGTEQGTDETRLEAGASAAAGGPLGVGAGRTLGVTYRESFAGDGYHRCEVDADGPVPAVGTTCPSSLADDSGLPPGGAPVP